MLTAQNIKANCSMAIIRWLRIKMPYEYLTMDITTYPNWSFIKNRLQH